MICLKERVTEYSIGTLPVVKIENITLFDAQKIFDCGQSFRFDKVVASRHEKEFSGTAHGRYISVAQDGDTVYIYNSTLVDYENIWRKYLALDQNYEDINNNILSLSDNTALIDALNCSSGIRILKQDEWEAICSFIISQNNNIPRIKKLVAALSQACGERLDISAMNGHVSEAHLDNVGNLYSFPSPASVMALGIDGLAALKTGFRAKYIYDAAEKICSGKLDLNEVISCSDTTQAIEMLCDVKGIGLKVASCALLFGFARLDAFPIDVWIKKVMAKYFSADFDHTALGRFAGIAQQYLFYYERYLKSKEE